MSDQFIGEIRIFATNFAPSGWAMCNGQLMPISQNSALFALLGVTYGGDGRTTFALPDLRGRAPMQPGAGAGLSYRNLGEQGGSASVTLLASEIPPHTHQLMHSGGVANSATPGPGNAFGRSGVAQVYSPGSADTATPPQALMPSGGGLPHNNLQPYLAVNFCIALQGVWPSRP